MILGVLTGLAILLMGVLLIAGGGWLVMLGGSLAYLAMGAGLLLVGGLMFRRPAWARLAYAAFLLAVLAWALFEVGLDWWALAPRGALFTLVGLWLLLPWVGPRDPQAGFHRDGRAVLAAVIAIVVGAAALSILNDPFVIRRTLPPPTANLSSAEPLAGADWPAYGGDRYGRRFSSLADIQPANVGKLQVAWTYRTGERRGPTEPNETTFEVTPLKIGPRLYLCTAHNRVVALDAATGAQAWAFDPKVRLDKSSEHLTCRGVAHHADPAPAAGAICPQRIIAPTGDGRLFALDAQTGKPCGDFGQGGVVSLLEGMPYPKRGFYMATSPPVIVGGLAVVGAAINDNVSAEAPSGVVRAYDVRTGRLAWAFDPGSPSPNAIPQAGQTFSAGGPNMWAPPSADEALGLVYLPLGNKSPDQWGLARSPQVERFSSSVVALDAASGQLRWSVQTVHHDIWDRDVPAQPTLLDLPTAHGAIPALIAPTKQGDLFVLDRRTGAPVFPVKDVPVAGRSTAGDRTSPTQPQSALSFMPPPLREADMWGATPFDQLYCRVRFRVHDYVGPYTPPSERGAIVYPGNTGVFNWGGVAVDPRRPALIASPVRLAFVQQLVRRKDPTGRYVSQGSATFGENFGSPYAVAMWPLRSPLGLPCQAPPWGGFVGVDLRDGKTAWRIRNGTVRDSFPILPLPLRMGVPSLGGALVTAGGVAFYSGTLDDYLRAYDVASGRLLWEGRLPAGGQATPMTYRAPDGRQMVVVAAGGHGTFGTKLGDYVVAFALPRP